MSIDPKLGLDPIRRSTDPQQAPDAANNSTEFRRMLEKLESVARESKPQEVQDIDKLHDAMRHADDEYAAVMDLRRRLEDAYRNVQQ